MHEKISRLIIWSITIISVTSCTRYTNIAYFKDIPDSTRASILNARYRQLIIHPDDILSISVQTIDPLANEIFTQSTPTGPAGAVSTLSGTLAQSPAGGFLVDKNGIIELPMLGKFTLAGLTTTEARDTIQKAAESLYKNPAVYVRFANLKVTVLGEVSHPGTYVLANEKNTIFDALGLAGDLTIFGKRNNALLMRDSAGYTNMIRFNLTSKDLINQDYFFLKQNDVIYIEPNRSKIASQDAIATRNYAIIVSVLSLLIIAASRIN